MRGFFGACLSLGLMAAVTGCPPAPAPAPTPPAKGGDPAKSTDVAAAPTKAGAVAEAELIAKSKSALKGKVRFVEKDGQITCTITVEGLSPGLHAAHIHDKGDCSAEDGSSAGGHWNPTKMDHGEWGGEKHHLGDLFNIEVGPDGKGENKRITKSWSIGTGAENDVVGHSVIVHEKVDDYKTQPTGNAGGRIGCGEIKLK